MGKVLDRIYRINRIYFSDQGSEFRGQKKQTAIYVNESKAVSRRDAEIAEKIKSLFSTKYTKAH
jgi:hypothetical protein